MKTSIRKFGVVGLPLIALAVVVMVLAWGHSAPTKTEAVGEGQAVAFSLRSDDCIGGPVDTTAGDATCNIGLGAEFVVGVDLNSFAVSDYDGFDASLTYSGVTSNDDGSFTWPDCVFGAFSYGAGTVLGGCGIGIGAPSSTYTGELIQNTFVCTADESSGNTVTLVHGAASGNTNIADSTGTGHAEKGTETLTIECVPPPTATPTPTPPPVPAVQKLPALDNLFLVAQESGKLPPAICEAGESVAALTESISQEIVTTVPPGIGKDPTATQELAAFQFSVHFDPALVCVDLVPADGEGQAAENMICMTQAAKGVVEIGCVTMKQTDPETGEDITAYPDTSTEEGQKLALVEVRPQPELYSEIIANQANGVAVQILDQECQLNDQDGHAIPIYSCEDADITIRYLEGDVMPDCSVGAVDEQAMAFRWGAELGSLLYNPRFDLVPSGSMQGDGYIHIGDLQFVFGRHNSTCDDPNPAQDPINPKEK